MDFKLLIYGLNFYPEPTGVGKYTGEFCEWLANKGVKLRVITAPPYYPWWEVISPWSNTKYCHENLNKIEILRCPIYVPKRPTGFSRIAHLFSFAISSLPLLIRQIKNWKPNLIFLVIPTFFCVPATVFLSRISKVPIWAHLQDLEIDAAFDLGIIPNFYYIKKVTYLFERFLLNNCQVISTISENMKNKLIEKQIPQNRILIFPNWVNPDEIYPLNRPSILRSEWQIPIDKLVCLYSGSLGKKQGIELIFEVAANLEKYNDLLFIVCGEGTEWKHWKNQYAMKPNIKFFPLQPRAKLNELLNLADIHLLPQKNEISDLVMPSKLIGMLASGKPVVACANLESQIYKILQDCGLCVKPGSVDSFTKAIIQLSQQPILRNQLGAKGREKAISLWNRNLIFPKIYSEMFKLICSCKT